MRGVRGGPRSDVDTVHDPALKTIIIAARGAQEDTEIGTVNPITDQGLLTMRRTARLVRGIEGRRNVGGRRLLMSGGIRDIGEMKTTVVSRGAGLKVPI